jgi:lysine 2,3-aminomutase
MNIHVNHSSEITLELAQACDRLARAGVPLGNQSVLLAGVNDSVHIQRELVHKLVMMRVRPYYLYQCDLVEGAGHFRTSTARGLEIIEGLRGHTSGYAVPHYIIDAPGGGGKIPVMPNYVLSQAPGKIVLRNYEGFITTYTEPTDYDPEAIRHLDALAARRPEPGQAGVLGLLEGERITIEPDGFAETHARGAEQVHRLKADPHKWQPLGIGEAKPGIGEPEKTIDPATAVKGQVLK